VSGVRQPPALAQAPGEAEVPACACVRRLVPGLQKGVREAKASSRAPLRSVEPRALSFLNRQSSFSLGVVVLVLSLLKFLRK